LQERDGDLGTARSLGESENVVRIMSIHKSKGLEFPVVFVAGMGKKFNLTDTHKSVLIHKELGLGPYAVDLELRNLYPTLPRLAIAHRLQMEALAEEMRILYVAMTRAREKLYLVGSVKDLARKTNEWSRVASAVPTPYLPEALLASARSFLDWVGPAVYRHPDVNPAAIGIAPGQSHFKLLGDPLFVRPEQDAGEALVSPEHDTSSFLQGEVNGRLNWRYPWMKGAEKMVKATVTELKRRLVQEDLPAYQYLPDRKPLFATESTKISRARLGTAVHLMMQNINLEAGITKADLQKHKANMVERRLLTSEEAEAINEDMFTRFFAGPLGERLLKADRVWRELPFSLRIPASEVHGVEAEGEHVLVQGVIDCLFAEGEKLVLVDFKTDRVSEEQLQDVVENYRPQLAFYRRAVEQLFRKTVKESYLCLLEVGREVSI